jgi:hypothetical protein
MDEAILTGLMAAVVNDEAAKKRLTELQSKIDELNAAQASFDAKAIQHQEQLKNNLALRDGLEKAHAVLLEREQKLGDDRAALTAYAKGVDDNKKQYSAFRETVDKEHAEREAMVSRREAAAAAAEKVWDERAAEVRAREQRAEMREARHAHIADHVQAIGELIG